MHEALVILKVLQTKCQVKKLKKSISICDILSLQIDQMIKEKIESKINRLNLFILDKQSGKKKCCRSRDICIFNVPRASFAKQLRSTKHEENS